MPTNLSTFLGSTFIGTQGAQGLQGLQGRQGLQGLSNQGSQGLQGLSNQGSQGLQGLSNQGSQGLQGLSNQGVQGTQGLQGLSNQGTQGLVGPIGINYWEKTAAGIHTLSKVGIGTTNPTALITVKSQSVNDFVGLFSGTTNTDLVRITQDGTGNALRVDDQAGGTTPFIVDNLGKVGINTLTATSNLTVFGNSLVTGISTSQHLDGTAITTLSGSVLAYSYRMTMP